MTNDVSSSPSTPAFSVKDGVMVTEEAREQLLEASSVTKKAYSSYRREAEPEETFGPAEGQQSGGDKAADNGEMSFVILIMQPILRFLQLLCENHNRDLQVCLVCVHDVFVCVCACVCPGFYIFGECGCFYVFCVNQG